MPHTRRIRLIVLLLLASLGLVGYSAWSPAVDPYSRTPFTTRIERMLQAGRDLYHRRCFEQAREVFRAIRLIDPNNIESVSWVARCEEQLRGERNEATKAGLLRRYGSLSPKSHDLNWKKWGPMAGHFEVRIPPPRTYIPPPPKIRTPASDGELEKARQAAQSDDPQALFQLALLHRSRGELSPALVALDRAVVGEPSVLEQDDEGICQQILADFEAKAASGSVQPGDRLAAARAALLQGESLTAALQFVQAASRDDALREGARQGLARILQLPNRPPFLRVPPEITFLALGYTHEGGKDLLHVALEAYPTTPVFLFPLDLALPFGGFTKVQPVGRDCLMVLTDPQATGTTRVFLVGRDDRDEVEPLKLRATFELDPQLVGALELTSMLPFNLQACWAFAAGAPDAFDAGTVAPTREDAVTGGVIRAWRLFDMGGRGPFLALGPFRTQPLNPPIGVWGFIDSLVAPAGP